MNDLRAFSICALGLTMAGCSYFSERFDAPKPKPARYSVPMKEPVYSNPYRHKPVARALASEEAMPRQSKGSVYDKPPLMECRTDWCIKNCDPEVMPRPKACIYYKVPGE